MPLLQHYIPFTAPELHWLVGDLQVEIADLTPNEYNYRKITDTVTVEKAGNTFRVTGGTEQLERFQYYRFALAEIRKYILSFPGATPENDYHKHSVLGEGWPEAIRFDILEARFKKLHWPTSYCIRLPTEHAGNSHYERSRRRLVMQKDEEDKYLQDKPMPRMEVRHPRPQKEPPQSPPTPPSAIAPAPPVSPAPSTIARQAAAVQVSQSGVPPQRQAKSSGSELMPPPPPPKSKPKKEIRSHTPPPLRDKTPTSNAMNLDGPPPPGMPWVAPKKASIQAELKLKPDSLASRGEKRRRPESLPPQIQERLLYQRVHQGRAEKDKGHYWTTDLSEFNEALDELDDLQKHARMQR